MAVTLIKGTDVQFTIRIIKKSNSEPFDLTGLTGTDIELKLPTDNAPLALTLTANANGSKLELVSELGGKLNAVISDLDTVNLKAGDGQNMELTIKEGAGPDFEISKVQFVGELNVKPSLFEE